MLLFNIEDSEAEEYVLRNLRSNKIDSFRIDLVSELKESGYPIDYILRSQKLEDKENKRIDSIINKLINDGLITTTPHRLTTLGRHKCEEIIKKSIEVEEKDADCYCHN